MTVPASDRPLRPREPGAVPTGGPVIAVDGPSGAGKSTVARGVAGRLGLRYLDTGAMYRAVTKRLLDQGVDLTDAEAVARAAAAVDLEPGTDPGAPRVTADGLDLTAAVRGVDVTAAVSTVSAVPAVREQLVAQQRALIGTGGIVVEGRDIGTTVAPAADVKVFLTADAGARALRRSLESRSSQETSDLRRTEAELLRRDAQDSGRAASPLTRAPDAVLIDTTDLGIDAVVERVVGLVQAARPGLAALPVPPSEPLPHPAPTRPRLVQPRGARRPRVVRAARRLGRLLLRRRVLRAQVIGVEHVPLTGPALLAGNHTGFLDGPMVFATAPREAQFFIKAEMYDGPLARALDWLGQIPVNRGRPDRPALKRGLAALRAGEAVGMFPEGTRGSGELRTIQHGIGYLALKAGCPVVPVACFGTHDALPEGSKRLRLGTHVDVVYGPPFTIEPAGDHRTRRAMAAAAEEIRTRLAAHLAQAAELTGRPLPSAERGRAAEAPPGGPGP